MALVVVLQLPLVGIPRTLADVLFSYDNAGQLSQVTDQNGYNASYSHDSSDNLLSIGGNVPTKETEVWLITPSAGATRTQVTIFGANFSATPSADAVAFGGVAATVSTASASQLTVVVPSGAQSGVVTVTTSNGKGQSPGPFTVE
ncbi:MAG: IPT/TIG domain-containing protein [Candidatus Binataceae bacterium]